MKDNQCPLCGAYNVCAQAEGKTTCWCFIQPPIDKVKDGSACLCPPCYERATQPKPAKDATH